MDTHYYTSDDILRTSQDLANLRKARGLTRQDDDCLTRATTMLNHFAEQRSTPEPAPRAVAQEDILQTISDVISIRESLAHTKRLPDVETLTRAVVMLDLFAERRKEPKH